MATKRITDRNFFTCNAEELAKQLVGKILCHKIGNGKDQFVIKARIKVTEAYRENDDCLDDNRNNMPTSQRLEGGHIHFHNAAEGRRRMDIVANKTNIPESVLIAETDMYDGPQKTLWALDLDNPECDGIDIANSNSEIWVEDDGIKVELNPPMPRKNIADTTPLRFSAKSFIFE